jgi:CBS domain-containing protein
MSWTVAAVMTPDVVTIESDASLKSCLQTMRMHGVGALPVRDHGKLAGIVTGTDLLVKEFRPTVRERLERPPSTTVKATAGSLMTRQLVTVRPDEPVVAAVRRMFEHKISRLPVVDCSGALVGIVSRTDILRVFMRSDISIRKEVTEEVLADKSLLGTGQVRPEVREGVVTLDGEVESGPLTSVLLRVIAGIPGVVGVHNRLQVRRKQPVPKA